MKTKQKQAENRPRTHAEINEYRRKSFVEGALLSLAQNGVSGTTVATICKAAGSSRGLLGHYFASKDEVMVAALEHLFGKIADAVKISLERIDRTEIERLMALPEVLFDPSIFSELNRTAFLALWHETRFNMQVRKSNRRLYSDYVDRMEQLFRAAAVEAEVELDARRAALGLIALSDGLWLGLSIHDNVTTNEQAIQICQSYISKELGLRTIS